MHSGSMSLLGYPGACNATSYRTHCYIPVALSLCSSNISPTFGCCLPSTYQGNLWLLDPCQESYYDVPSCESSSCEPKTCTTSCDPPNSCVPSNYPSAGQVVSACETINISPSTSCNPCTQTEGYVYNCYTPTQCESKACQTIRSGSNCSGQLNCFSKSLQPLNYCRLGSLRCRSYQNLGFIPSGNSSSYYVANSCQPKRYLIRNCQYPSYGLMSYQPLSYFSRNFPSLSCIPRTFPPLRYLFSGSRPLHCY
ncbi:PREDICTED: keratin-associated protein 24-1 [Galeopterus variegatus]|uniref:Keratin-associated protein n=1 Tax=Galeopterus variegatus TaxID=482537 RepID=A0ABM0QYG8_GALVR|nr:PREDICTED: keratin-associated protein 24-1 [Galeopterus variegatus]